MPISQYTSDNHICKCGEKLVRDIDDFCSSFDTKNITGFFGKSK